MHCPAGGTRVLQVHPTRRCNLACDHCYSSSGPHAQEELPLSLLLPCVEDAARLGYTQLAVSGGEPLLYRGLAKLLAHARSAGMKTTMTTNGMLATYSRWEPIAPLVDVLAVSIDGCPAEHDRIRGRAGAFQRTLENLEVLRESGVAFGFIFTLTQQNVDSLEFVVRLAAEQGARSVQVHPLTLHGRAGSRMPQSRPDSFELVAALFEAYRLGGEFDVAVHVDALMQEQILAHRDRLVPAQPVRELADAAPILVVEADSTVVPLTHEVSRHLALGRLVDAPLPLLAREWIATGRAAELAAACDEAWKARSAAGGAPAVYWYEEVAARTRGIVRLRRSLEEIAVGIA
jgi:MoaA/NifB/PqqE/SkfB family radical SAM enzyme